MQSELISVIVPIYNAEKYLDKCIDSIIKQSYQCIEIILIDDGSTDTSSTICDIWAKKDARVKVLHNTNCGVAASRNAGLEAAAGEYIAFVDSDDYIAADMIQTLYTALKKSNADMSICSFLHVDENGSLLAEKNEYIPIRDEVVSGSAIIGSRMSGKRDWYYNLLWNKLYKKHLFSEIRFPEGKLCEDAFVAHRILEKCSIVACISNALYYYVQSTGSIVRSKTCKFFLHASEAYLDRTLYCYEHAFYRCGGHSYCQAALYLQDAYLRRHSSPELKGELEMVFQIFKHNIILRRYCSLKERIKVDIIYLHPLIYHYVFQNPLRLRFKAFIAKLF